MADTKINALSLATAAVRAMNIPVDNAGTDKRVTIGQILDLLDATASNGTQTPAASATTYLTGSDFTVPAGSLQLLTRFRWRVFLSKTAASATALTFIVKIGTLGTTGDTSALSFAFTAGTAAVDAGYVDIECIVVGPLGASCVTRGYAMMIHQLTTTGLCSTTSPAIVTAPTVVNIDSSAATKVGLAVTTGASMVLSVQQIVGDVQGM